MNKNVSYRINVETKHTRSDLIQIPCLSARAPDPSSWLPVTTCENLPTLSQTVSLRQPRPALNHFWVFSIIIKTICTYVLTSFPIWDPATGRKWLPVVCPYSWYRMELPGLSGFPAGQIRPLLSPSTLQGELGQSSSSDSEEEEEAEPSRRPQ